MNERFEKRKKRGNYRYLISFSRKELFNMSKKKGTVFEAVTKDAATLAALLGSLPVLEAPWDDEFHKRFCSSCDAENCDAENCPNNAFRNNPEWWLSLPAAEVEQ